MTSLEEGKLVLKKLLDESIPVLAFLAAADGSSAKLSGFVDSCTNEVGIVVAAKNGAPAESTNLRLAVGAEGLAFSFGDERELAPELREYMVGRFGNTVLTVRVLESGSLLVLFFNS